MKIVVVIITTLLLCLGTLVAAPQQPPRLTPPWEWQGANSLDEVAFILNGLKDYEAVEAKIITPHLYGPNSYSYRFVVYFRKH